MKSVRRKFEEAFRKIRSELKDFEGPKFLTGRRIFLLALMAIPALFLTSYFAAFTLMVLTVALSLTVNRYNLNRFGLELATFSTVTMATVFGPRIGALLGLVYICLQMFSGSTPGVYMIWVVPSYAAAGYLTAGLNIDIVTLGIYTSVTLQSIFTLMTFLTSRGRLPKFIQYVVFNLAINFFLFKTVARPFLSAVGVQ
ncbi:hypothetical protein ACK3SF_03845 [Candidatus Nanosalina sp. VS9-1]|uniref:hypothetical protein n=1 Tax=Candidatus Nanosalina sp. VS9-1 TaxID=3388566 RepID=UPI0039DFD27D